MIFLTVGTQLPFDRLVRAMDDWAKRNPQQDVFGQIADPGADGYYPQFFEWQKFVEPDEFAIRFGQSKIAVAHAGMGSIISALTNAKPIVIMPRFAKLGEHRNDHQLATAEQFQNRAGVRVAKEESALASAVDALLSLSSDDTGGEEVSEFADPKLIDTVRHFIQS
ncbi:glycosyltransferase [Sneathiella aquimaris]|uniref:glycosyltransferase n=1 Tax=Sneathiella aquimaris TaxID=2599305 RepID=UPI00146D99B0|nr:glycosyltransferase [Sneathiella aquimaris]